MAWEQCALSDSKGFRAHKTITYDRRTEFSTKTLLSSFVSGCFDIAKCLSGAIIQASYNKNKLLYLFNDLLLFLCLLWARKTNIYSLQWEVGGGSNVTHNNKAFAT